MSDTPHPDKLEILIEQMRELRAELREFIGFIQTETNEPKPKPEWKIGDKVRINGSMHSTDPIECHRFETGEIVELIDYVNEILDIPWNAKSESGEKWWISESEAELITE